MDVDELQKELTVDEGLHQLGIDLSKEELYERYGRVPPEEDDDKLPGMQGQPPGGMGGGLGGLLGGGDTTTPADPSPQGAGGGTDSGQGFADQGDTVGVFTVPPKKTLIEEHAEGEDKPAGKPFRFSEWAHYIDGR